jgi:DNA-binding MarR family transcriptional regulator
MQNDGRELTAEQIDELNQRHIGRLLLRAQRDFSLRAIAKLRERGHAGLGLTHTGVLAHMDSAGTRITTLAERSGITKQAIGRVVGELEDSGYIVRVADPADGRATLITYTPTGWQFLQDSYWIKREIEAEYTALLGEEGMENLRALLATLLAPSSAAGPD